MCEGLWRYRGSLVWEDLLEALLDGRANLSESAGSVTTRQVPYTSTDLPHLPKTGGAGFKKWIIAWLIHSAISLKISNTTGHVIQNGSRCWLQTRLGSGIGPALITTYHLVGPWLGDHIPPQGDNPTDLGQWTPASKPVLNVYDCPATAGSAGTGHKLQGLQFSGFVLWVPRLLA